MSVTEIAKRLDLRHNVSIRVLDGVTKEVVSEHTGHNASTNSLLTGIAHYLTGDGVLGQNEVLENWVPQYISLGTMGLFSQDEDEYGYPAGVGNVDGPEQQRYEEYMQQCPGFGADGYDGNLNNNRTYLGLGPMFADRPSTDQVELIQLGDINRDGKVDEADLALIQKHLSGEQLLTDEIQLIAADANKDNIVSASDLIMIREHIAKTRVLGKVKHRTSVNTGPTVSCELVSLSYPRSSITYREVVPETQAEYPKTIDVVFSAFVSTGALAQFREPGKDYIFITEAGLWSRPDWTDSGDNGLLAGYRITPPDEKNWDMSIPYNRELLRKNIIKVGINQVVQVIWKIQIGGLEQLGGIEKLYPSESRPRWTVYK